MAHNGQTDVEIFIKKLAGNRGPVFLKVEVKI